MKTRVWWAIAVIAVGVVLAPLALWSVRDTARAEPTKDVEKKADEDRSNPAGVSSSNSLEPGDRILLSPGERHIFAELHSDVSLEFAGIPLSEVLSRLAEEHHLNILINEATIQEAGLSSDGIVDMELDEMTLATALNLLLSQFELTYDIRDDVLVITARDALAQRVFTRAYHLEEEKSPQESKRLVHQIERLLMADRIDRLRQASKYSEGQESAAFGSSGPAPVIEIFGDRMVIAGTLADHEHIRELLRLIFGDIPVPTDH